MEYTVYIIYSEILDSFYVGQTNDLNDRLLRHNSGREKYTRLGMPWILIWSTIKPNRNEALQLERKLKNIGTKRKIEFMIKYQEDIAGPDASLLLQQWSRC